MSRKVRVALHGFMQRYVVMDKDATKGAQVGDNLYWPDGTVVQEDEIRNGTGSNIVIPPGQVNPIPGELPPTSWDGIIDIPPILDSITEITNDGWLRKDANSITASNWPYIDELIEAAETVVVPARQQMLLVEQFDIEGALDNEGTVAVL